MRKNKFLLITFILFSLIKSLASLEYSDVYADVSEFFSVFIDQNEGLTSFRSLLIPSGGRPEALGNAYTGMANDVSYIEYNPAASAVLDETEIGVFHNAWILDTNVESFVFTSRKRNLGWGAQIKALYLPFTEYDLFGNSVSAGYYSETIAAINLAYNFFAGYTFKGLAVGTSFKTAFRSVPDYVNSETDQIDKNAGLGQSGLAFMADLGFLFRFNAFKFYSSREANMQVGLSFMHFGAGITGFAQADGVFLDDPLPSKINLGFSYKPIRPLSFVADISQPLNLQSIGESALLSFGGGMALQITPFFALHSGFFLSGGNPRFSLGSEFMLFSYLANVNYTLDLTSSINPISRFSLALKMNLGDKGRKSDAEKVDEFYVRGLEAYYLLHLEEAIRLWEEALEIDPGFDPAIIAIKAAQATIDIQEKIRDIQKLE